MYCKHSELLDVDSGRTYWRTSPNYVFCVQRNHNVSAPFPTPTSPKAACYDDTESTGLGCRGRGGGGLPLRFSSPLLANCEILAQLLRFQVSVSSFVKQGKLFPPFRVVGDINNGFHRESPVPLVTHVFNRPPLISVLYILLFPCLCSWAIKKQKNLLELIMENEPLPPPLDYDHMALRNLMALAGGTLPLVLQLRTWGAENNGWLEEGIDSGGEEREGGEGVL